MDFQTRGGGRRREREGERKLFLTAEGPYEGAVYISVRTPIAFIAKLVYLKSKKSINSCGLCLCSLLSEGGREGKVTCHVVRYYYYSLTTVLLQKKYKRVEIIDHKIDDNKQYQRENQGIFI